MYSVELQEPAIHKFQGFVTSLFYIVPLLAGIVYWLAFFPGAMSYDSIAQWDQLSTFKITNLHPAFHTILEWLLTRIWYSPAIISLFQVLFAALVIGYGLRSIHKASQLPAVLLIAIGFLLSANPLVGVMDVTLWKDVLYSLAILLLTIYLFNILSSDGKWFSEPGHFIWFGCSLAMIWLLRFNGFPIVVVSLILIGIIYRKYLKYVALSTLVTAALIAFVLGPVYSWFRVERNVEFNYGIAFIHPVVPYVNSPVDLAILSTAEKNYLNYIHPLDKAWPYSCYDATVFYYDNTNFYPVIDHPLQMVQIFAKLAWHDPKIALKHFLCLSSFIWQPNQPKNISLETIILDKYNLDQNPSWTNYKNILSRKSFLPQVLNLIQRSVSYEMRLDLFKLLWRPAIYMYAFFASLVYFIIRTSRGKWWLLSIPLIVQTVVIMLTAQNQALRYQYPIYLISMLFSIPLLLLGWKKVNWALWTQAGQD